MWNLKTKQTNEQSIKRLLDTEKRLAVALGEFGAWMGEIDEGDKEV